MTYHHPQIAKQSKRDKWLSHLNVFKQAHAKAFAEGNFDDADYWQECIDEVNAIIATIS